MSDSFVVQLVWLIPALPLIAAVATATLGPQVLRERSHWPCVIASILAALFSLAVLATVARTPPTVVTDRGDAVASAVTTIYDWIDVAGFRVPIVLRVDPLTALMLVMVTVVGSLIVVYSIGYMHGERGYWRYFSAVSLFLFSMTGLVLASNFLLLYVFWELVGLCSYLLIGFWYERRVAAAAAKKAFLVNRIGDFGFALGILLIWLSFDTLDFDHVFGALLSAGDSATTTYPMLTVICLLLFCGAVGKSAQFPLHVWLPDAMEGPTPVSALIHAATMVTAGVYMVARLSPLFLLSASASMVVSIIGGVTALGAAIIAVTQTDLKRILAYSTVSQLGYMFLGLGCGVTGAVVAAIFHVFTHAFFKALLFLGAGSVMHAMGGVIDIRRLGGLSRRMPITCWTFACGAAALAGFPGLSGFWSKDAILAELAEAGSGGVQTLVYRVLLVSATLTAFLTSLYSFRAFFRTFWGEEKIPAEAGEHAHESPPVMTWPLIVLSIFAALLGAVVVFVFNGLLGFLARTPGLANAHAAHNTSMMITSSVVAVAGAGLAWLMYGHPSGLPDVMAHRLGVLYELSRDQFRLNELYDALIVRPVLMLAEVCRVVDEWVVDGIVRLIATFPAYFGRIALRPIQNGVLQYYALGMVFGLVALMAALAGWLK
jgi:NADH-quinone oxidoreductase subunit L